ncbi:GGDEF domain-containing protein [Sphaerotilus montanus]|jgi:diguanylate cyclase (GGDEF)-like protein|uniref:Diguanylate cyclase (GGDEF)-like protein n=1 Tax=Sphaerotilus montanus TaxID=522889 RepID=A0A7Y9R067_9BURK|nr:GGDEF domain-containing protein [Sphaerotilus montanus]NYG33889.1 diguanylate cyclase (GGDEF)-like protein [Sphaerotilus montanus]NZD58316.1 GGDEF domain-containing protein [Sphaerotilus montanus]
MNHLELPVSVAPPAQLAGGLLDLLQVEGALLALKDADSGCYLWANAPCLAWLGADAQRVVGATDLELLPQTEANALQAADARALAAGQAVVTEDHRFERAGVRTEFHVVRHVLAPADGTRQILSLWRDVTQSRRDAGRLQSALDQIERQQHAVEVLRRQHAQGLDRPSELFRREHFEEHLRREAALSQREHREFALVLLALDRVESMRQTLGDPAVQAVTQSMGLLMRTNTRAMDVLSQLGDGRFAILLSGVGLATAHSRMEHLRRACATEVVVVNGQGFNFEVSIGVASFPHTAATLADLSQAAVRALADARQRGGNRVALASIRLGELLPVH